MNMRPNIKSTILLSLAMAAVLLAAQVVQAERLRLQRVNKPRAASGPSSELQENRLLQLQGELRYQRGSLSINGVEIQLTRATGYYPRPDDGFMEPSDLNGRRAFVYAEDTGLGIRATLVMLRPKSSMLGSPKSEPYFVPSESNPAVGIYEPGSPR